jgi:Ketopantoate reductase PanE/ApbA
LQSTCSTHTGNHLAAAATMRDSFVKCEAYRNWSIRQINTRTIRRSRENNGLDAVVESPFHHSEIGVLYLVIPAGMLRCHEVHDPENASVEERTGVHILVLGAGALGSLVAAYLMRAGETVTMLARGARASYLRASGLRLCGVAEFTVPCTVVTDPRTVQEVDALVVAVKAYDTASALAGLRHLRVQSVFSV